jgi:signal transduction histidine kinase
MIDFKRIEDALRDEVLRALSGVTTDVRWDWQPPQMAGAMTVLRDVTDDFKTDQLRNQFLSIVAHELRTPLTGIKTFATMMARW